MMIAKKLVATATLVLALTFGAAGLEAVAAAPAAPAAAPLATSVRESVPVAGRFCKNTETGKVVGKLICKYDQNVNRNRWVVK